MAGNNIGFVLALLPPGKFTEALKREGANSFFKDKNSEVFFGAGTAKPWHGHVPFPLNRSRGQVPREEYPGISFFFLQRGWCPVERGRGRRCRGVSPQVLRDARVGRAETCPCSQELENLSPAGKGKPKPPWTGFTSVRVLMFLLSASSSALSVSAHPFFPFPHSWHPGGFQSSSPGLGRTGQAPPGRVGLRQLRGQKLL